MQVFGESLGNDAPAQARRLEEEGFDGLVAVDHFFSGHAPARPRWRVEPLVALGAAAAATSRITLAAMVMNVNFHHPAVIAHGMASLDELSGGRAELGLGGGWYAPEHEAFGLPWGEPRERAERLLEAAALCRQMLEHRGVAVHHGAHFDVDNQVAWDWEAKGHTVPVVIGGAAPSLLCRAAEVANRVDLLHAAAGGSPVIDAGHSRSADLVEALIKDLRDRAAAAGNTVSISATLTASLVPDDEAAAARERAAPALRSTPALLSRDLLYVIGGQGELMARIVALAELGVDRIHVIPAPPDPGRTVAAVREMLADVQRL